MAALKIMTREKLGTKVSRRLRAEGLLPGIVYGHGQANLAISLPADEIKRAIRHGERVLKGVLDGSEQNFLIKDVQYDYLGNQVIHVDLTRVRLDERVTLTVPVVLRGTPVGVATEGGVLSQSLRTLTVECLVTDIPEDLRVSVAALKLNDVLKVKDIPLPPNLTIKEEGETIVASVSMVAEEVVAAAEEAVAAVAEPEIIGAKPEEGEGEAPEAEKPAKKEKEKKEE
jgi:large subunit ribosomal protein L25